MSAFVTKQTWASAPHMSAFGSKACLFALQMSAYDPKRTFRFRLGASYDHQAQTERGVVQCW
jgi:hypothetical protein